MAAVLDLAAGQHGVVRDDQLRAIGVDRSALFRLTDAGVLEPFVGRGIRRVTGGEPSPHQRLLASVWAGGPHAAASHRAGAWLWSIEPITSDHIDVAVPPRSGRRPTGAILHYASDLRPAFVTTVDGIPVIEATLTLLDLASVVDADDLECAFDSALRQGLTSFARARTILRRFGRRGRNGTAALRALLEVRADGDGISDSKFETRMAQVLRRGGLPEPTRQVELFDADGFIGRFDCTYPPATLAIEADSVRHHHDRARFEADRERRVRAEAIGWTVPTFTWRHVTRRPAWVVSSVTAMLDASGWDWRGAVRTRSRR